MVMVTTVVVVVMRVLMVVVMKGKKERNKNGARKVESLSRKGTRDARRTVR